MLEVLSASTLKLNIHVQTLNNQTASRHEWSSTQGQGLSIPLPYITWPMTSHQVRCNWSWECKTESRLVVSDVISTANVVEKVSIEENRGERVEGWQRHHEKRTDKSKNKKTNKKKTAQTIWEMCCNHSNQKPMKVTRLGRDTIGVVDALSLLLLTTLFLLLFVCGLLEQGKQEEKHRMVNAFSTSQRSDQASDDNS